LAVAESSEFTAEARVFVTKAQRLADEHGIPPALLRFPLQPLQVAIVIAELQRLQTVLEAYDGAEELWATKSAEWSACLDEYDEVLEAAAELVQLPVRRLPYGSRRHFRPEERATIEALIQTRVR
jgi:hypothetical protein